MLAMALAAANHFLPICQQKKEEPHMNDPTPKQPARNKALNKERAKHLSVLAHMSDEKNSTDVLGSYTGMAQNGEPPVQDADDL